MPEKIILHSTYKNNWEIITWTIPVIFSAPHAVPQFRDGEIKPCDEYTWEIVRKLCQETWAYGIIRIKNLDDDPNYYNEWLSLDFKNEIIEMMKDNDIRYGFDIHGCRDGLWFSIDIGTNYGKNINEDTKLLSHIQRDLKNNLWDVVVDTIFEASKKEIVSTYVSEQTGCPYIELEICRALREKTDYIVSLISKVVKNTFAI